MKFEIMCIDSNGKVVSKSIDQLLFAFLSNGRLFNDWIKKDSVILAPDEALSVSIQKYPSNTSEEHEPEYHLSYTITVESEQETILDEFRIDLLSYIKNQIGFSAIRILRDELSKKYASDVYSILYELENNVRTFITNFFLKNIGVEWTNVVLEESSREKIKKRIANEEIFIKPKLVDADVLLLDFDELGAIIFETKSIFYRSKSTEAILRKIETSTNLDELKKDVLSGSFSKYFKDCFEQQSFKKKWDRLYLLRNKVAHNSYFKFTEVNELKELCNEISEIIENAYDKLDTFRLSPEDKELVKSFSTVEDSETTIATDIEIDTESKEFILPIDDEKHETITEDDVKEAFDSVASTREFVGLQYFIRTYLVEKGYDYKNVLYVVNKLIDDGYFVKSTRTNPYGFYDTTTIEKSNNN